MKLQLLLLAFLVPLLLGVSAPSVVAQPHVGDPVVTTGSIVMIDGGTYSCGTIFSVKSHCPCVEFEVSFSYTFGPLAGTTVILQPDDFGEYTTPIYGVGTLTVSAWCICGEPTFMGYQSFNIDCE